MLTSVPAVARPHVPDVHPTAEATLSAFASRLPSGPVAVLTGAGCSTESGIPDYRGEGTRRRARSPIQYKQFIESEETRRRYWARAVLGWRRFRDTQPNAAHRAFSAMEADGRALSPITQNVDRLHQRAGSRDVLELHGALEEVTCLDCRAVFDREDVQKRLLHENPWIIEATAETAPDGDADLDDGLVRRFRLVGCPLCGGRLKPHVVFFGESVPRGRVEAAYDRVASAEGLLVVGTSLAVFSGYRFARRAAELGRPIFVINVGPTRADDLATAKLEALAGDAVPRLAAQLRATASGSN